MFAKPKNGKKEYSNETILVTLALHGMRKLHRKIADYIKILKLTIT